jgi:dipeptidyl aminopeptidase/acylaminoacyl peptidase
MTGQKKLKGRWFGGMIGRLECCSMSRVLSSTVAVCGLLSLVLTPPSAFGQEAKRSLSLDDLARLRTVTDPQVSPDGKWVAYVVGAVDAEKDTRDTDLWMVAWDGRERVRLTASPGSAERLPRWSPDGRYLAFLASRGDEEEKKNGAQVWLLDRFGGEAQKATDMKGGVSGYAWSPDGKRLCLVVDDFDPNSEPEKLEGWKRKTAPPVVIDRYHFKSDSGGYLTRLYSHLTLFDLATRTAEILTSGVFDDESPSWSPDGKAIAFVSNRTPDPDRNEDTNIFVVEARAGASPAPMTTYGGRDAGIPSWSPDGRWIAYFQEEETKYSAYGQDKLAIVPSGGGPARLLTPALDRAASGAIVWAPDSGSVRVVIEDDRGSYVARVDVATGAVTKLTGGRRTVSSISAGQAGALGLLVGSASEPDEVHALEDGALRRLSRENDAWRASVQLPSTDDFTCTARDGTVVNGLVWKPVGFTSGKSYPTLLIIHGGPNAQDDYSFDFQREFFSANGYVVLGVNYRGSSGRGQAFQKAIFADWGNTEVVDLLAAVDWAIGAGIADPDRLGIGGWSYGGILTDYTIASDHRFKAAVSGAGSALQLSMYGTDQYTSQYDNELGPPWQNRDQWLKVSYPFFHADRITTPTLFMGGDRDFNVPIAGSEQMYQALKSLNVETQLVVYPDQHHSLKFPSYLRDRYARWLGWFDRFLKQ